MLDFFGVLVSMVFQVFGLFDIPIMGVPLYVIFVFLFVMSSLAKFIYGRGK